MKINSLIKKLDKHIIPIPIYGGDLILILTNDIEAVFTAYDVPCPKYIPDDGIGCIRATAFRKVLYTGKKNDIHYVIAFPLRKSIAPGTIAHEAHHITKHILQDRGIPIDPNNDENECYLLGWIVNQVHDWKTQKKVIRNDNKP